jgi:hypothetical protein
MVDTMVGNGYLSNKVGNNVHKYTFAQVLLTDDASPFPPSVSDHHRRWWDVASQLTQLNCLECIFTVSDTSFTVIFYRLVDSVV